MCQVFSYIWQYFLKRTLCDGGRLHAIKYFSIFLIFTSFQINTYLKRNAICLSIYHFLLLQTMPVLPVLLSQAARGLAFHSFPVLCKQQRPSYTSVGSKRPLQEMGVSSKGQACHSKHLRFPYFYTLLRPPPEVHRCIQLAYKCLSPISLIPD